MHEFPADVFHLIYGLTYFGLGLAVVVHALAYPASAFRHRLFAFGAFGLLHAIAIWLVLTNAITSTVPSHVQGVFTAPSFLALYYFAFGWRERWSMAGHGITLATICSLIIASVSITDSALMQFVTRLGVAMPAAICAALVFMLDSSFRFGSRSSDMMRQAVAIGFMVYATMHLLAELAAFLPASTINGVNLTLLAGTSAGFIRGGVIVLITGGILALLRRFEAAAHQQMEARISEEQDALAAVNASLKRVQEFGKLGNWEWNLTNGEVQWSDQTCRIYGIKPQEFTATQSTVLEYVHPEDRALVETEMQRVVRQRIPYRSEHRIVRPNGNVRFVQVQGEVETGSDGAAHRMLGTTRDVTELVKAKMDLVAAKVAAEEANTAKSNFMANMSHELRTPLNAILGFSEIMETELYGPHSNPLYRAYAADISKSGKHLLSVIGDILSVSRFEAGKTEFKEEAAINIEELLRKCARWVDGQASKAGVVLRSAIAPDLPALRGDSRLLIQAILNLLSNAVKFTPRDGSVELSASENRIGGITIAVRDTGVGMTPDQIARIGERFLQFDDTMNRKFEGTGLGLSITKEYVALHGGQLDVQSTPNVGTTFSINLPPGRSVRRRTRQVRGWGGTLARSGSS